MGYASCPLTGSYSRDVHDVVHKVTAVGSRSVHSAVQFITEHANGDPSIKAYGSYAEVYADNVSSYFRLVVRNTLVHKEIAKNVDAIYIGSWQYHFCR